MDTMEKSSKSKKATKIDRSKAKYDCFYKKRGYYDLIPTDKESDEC